eukprot:scaffold56631_cov44-Phaeocystis_antarctica.AAC.2
MYVCGPPHCMAAAAPTASDSATSCASVSSTGARMAEPGTAVAGRALHLIEATLTLCHLAGLQTTH